MFTGNEFITGSTCGGFVPAGEDLGRTFDHSFPVSAFLFFGFFFVEISSRTLCPLFMSGSVHGGSAS